MHKFARTWKKTPYGGRLIRTYRRSVILFVLVLVLGWLIFTIATHQREVQAPTLPAKAVQAQEAPGEPDLSGIAYITKTEETIVPAQPVAPQKAQNTYLQVFSKVCNGDAQCAKDLYAIAEHESHLNPQAVGDGGKSYGLFQIHRGYHPDITVAQATDPFWSATWTISRLKAHGYPTYRTQAIRKHNGSLNNPKTLRYFYAVDAIAKTI